MASTRRFLTGRLSVPDCITPPTPPEGTTDHSALTNRDLPDQHPIDAITGLSETLNALGEVDKTNFEALQTVNTILDDIVDGANIFFDSTPSTPEAGATKIISKSKFALPPEEESDAFGFFTSSDKTKVWFCEGRIGSEIEDTGMEVQIVSVTDISNSGGGSEFVPGINMFMGYFGRLPVSPDVITIRKGQFIATPTIDDTVIGFLIGEADVVGRLFVCRCVVKEATSIMGIPGYKLEVRLVKEIPDIESSTPTPTQSGVPVGTIITSLLYTIPEGYLNCNGEVYNIADYPDLAAAFVTSFGKSNQFGGDGETTFAVPNLSDTFLYGVHFENQQMQHHIGETGGEETHTLTIKEMPRHSHATRVYNSTTFYSADELALNVAGDLNFTGVKTQHRASVEFLSPNGNDLPHNNLPPYFRIAYYIKY